MYICIYVYTYMYQNAVWEILLTSHKKTTEGLFHTAPGWKGIGSEETMRSWDQASGSNSIGTIHGIHGIHGIHISIYIYIIYIYGYIWIYIYTHTHIYI